MAELGTIKITTARGLIKSVKGAKMLKNYYGNSSPDFDNYAFATQKDYDTYMRSKTRKNKYGPSIYFKYCNASGWYWISLFKKE